ncbi:MAG: hypothetical protein II193_05200 [Lachnospiraceae bacterium]|nr:hypothetical protein [Lachnospiraceae bacterium]
MSNSININLFKSEDLKTNGLNNNSLFSQTKVIGIENEKNKDDAVAVNISRESHLKYENNSSNIKKQGVTSARELWENECSGIKRDGRTNVAGNMNELEIFRLDEPETYDKWMSLWKKEVRLHEEIRGNNETHDIQDLENCINGDPEKRKKFDEYMEIKEEERRISNDWRERRCMATGRFKNPVIGSYDRINKLEQIYSDETHDTSFNYYTKDSDNYRNSLWRYNSKFNVLLTTDIFKSLEKYEKSDDKKDKEKYESMMKKIDASIKEMKKAEKEYEGNHEWLRFGVKFWEDGKVTYHANYKGCKDKDGIMADSTDELLKKLMNN